MSSNAIQSQGTTLHISGSSGTPETITEVALTNPMVLTSVAHALVNGDSVTAASFAGADAADINGNVYIVSNVTTDTFAINFDSTGKDITDNTDSATMTPTAWIKVGELKNASGFDGSASEIDITNLDSTAKEFAAGLEDFGNFTVEVNRLDTDAGQAAVVAAKTAGTTKSWKVTLPSAVRTYTFSAFVKTFSFDLGGADGVLTGSIGLRMTGAVTQS